MAGFETDAGKPTGMRATDSMAWRHWRRRARGVGPREKQSPGWELLNLWD